MIFDTSKERKVYIEFTNPEHGGEGWGLGEVLWSPAKSKSGSDSWKVLKQIEPGDVVLHSVKLPGKEHMLKGASIVKAPYVEVDSAPPRPGRWAEYDKYLRVSLQSYSSFSSPVKVQDFLTRYKNELSETDAYKSFYTKNSIIAQKYVAEVPRQVFELLYDFITQHGNALLGNTEYSGNTEHIDDLLFPLRVETTTKRIIRDTSIIKELKSKYEDRCQICGQRMKLPNGNYYSEGHHLQKLGGLHKGPDVKENVIILCPNHHVEFDYGMIAIENGCIIHIDKSNSYHNKALVYTRDDLGHEYLAYHKKRIFNT